MSRHDELLTRRRAARRLRATLRKVDRSVADGSLTPAGMRGRRPLFEVAEVERFKASAPFKAWRRKRLGLMWTELTVLALITAGSIVYVNHEQSIPSVITIPSKPSARCPAGYPYYDVSNGLCYTQPVSATTPTTGGRTPGCPAAFPYYSDGRCYTQPPSSAPTTRAGPSGPSNPKFCVINNLGAQSFLGQEGTGYDRVDTKSAAPCYSHLVITTDFAQGCGWGSTAEGPFTSMPANLWNVVGWMVFPSWPYAGSNAANGGSAEVWTIQFNDGTFMYAVCPIDEDNYPQTSLYSSAQHQEDWG